MSFMTLPVAQLSPHQIHSVFNLLKLNLFSIYNTAIGWDEDEIMKEITDELNIYILYVIEGVVMGFASFQHSKDFEDYKWVKCLYLYQLHVHPSCRNQSIGSKLLLMIEKLAIIDGKVKLTCFKSNTALEWYIKKGYTLDCTDLSFDGKDCCYQILSKQI